MRMWKPVVDDPALRDQGLPAEAGSSLHRSGARDRDRFEKPGFFFDSYGTPQGVP
jgi:hypothetical protein